jgi:caa(3)-type oxidase subunit IV
MNDDTYIEKEQAHVSNTVYLIVGGFLIVLTAMEITVSYIHALRPVMVPILVVLAIAKFALIAMFFMHLRYEKWVINTMFVFPLTIATGVFLAVMGLFLYLSRHPVGPAFGIHYF